MEDYCTRKPSILTRLKTTRLRRLGLGVTQKFDSFSKSGYTRRMDTLFYAVFASLIIIALICQVFVVVFNANMQRLERLLLERYRSKIDKIPAIVSVLRSHSKKLDEYTELTDLHRIAIISPADNIYDLLEINTHITDRF